MRNLNRAIVGLVGLLATSSVHAADISYRAPVTTAEPGWTWTGFYIGGHGGYGWGGYPLTETNPIGGSNTVEIKPRGWIAGGHAGYNWQHGMFVGGLEIDLDVTRMTGTSSDLFLPIYGPYHSKTETDTFGYLGTVRARAGFTPMQNVLLYGTAGLALTQFQRQTSQTTPNPFPNPFVGLPQQNTLVTNDDSRGTLFGVAAGAGIEINVGNLGIGALLLRAEYLHYDFGGLGGGSSPNVFPFLNNNTKSGRLTADAARVGASIKF